MKPKLNLEYLMVQQKLIELKIEVIESIPNLNKKEKLFIKNLLEEIIEKL